jgi:hypothetical protein
MRFVSLRTIAFPRTSARTVAYRIVFLAPSPAGNLRLTIDLIAFQHGRAQVALFHGTAVGDPQRDLEVDLARTISRRMAKAMGGA